MEGTLSGLFFMFIAMKDISQLERSLLLVATRMNGVEDLLHVKVIKKFLKSAKFISMFFR